MKQYEKTIIYLAVAILATICVIKGHSVGYAVFLLWITACLF